MDAATTTKPYHHGELRAALVAAALDILERDGPAALSLRGLARSVGVSAMAPYHHFEDRAALLAAVAAAGFDQLQQRKLDLHAQLGASPKEALIAGTESYVRFVLDHPNLYRLMKGAEFADHARYPDLQRAAAAPAGMLMAILAQLFDGSVPPMPLSDCAQMLWGLSHGIGTLALDGQISTNDAEHLARIGARSMIDGWLARDARAEPR